MTWRAARDVLHLDDVLTVEDTRLWDRPFSVSWADFPTALSARIDDPTVTHLLRTWPPTSGVDQVRDLLWKSSSRPAVRSLVAGTEH